MKFVLWDMDRAKVVSPPMARRKALRLVADRQIVKPVSECAA